jgi:hypothetical protein
MTNELKAQYLYTFQNSYQNDELVILYQSYCRKYRSIKMEIYQYPDRRTPFCTGKFRNNVFQIVDNLYYNTDKVKYTFGADLMYTMAKSVYGSEVNGRFHFRENPTNGE